MSRVDIEPSTKGVITAKIVIALSFLLPYLADSLDADDIQHLVVYAPIWVFQISGSDIEFAPSFFGLLLFFYWLPYIMVGLLSYRFAEGKTSILWYVLGIFVLTSIGISFALPMATMPRASSGGIVYYSTVIPLPIISIVALVLIPLLRPKTLESPWTGTTNDVFPEIRPEDPSESTSQ